MGTNSTCAHFVNACSSKHREGKLYFARKNALITLLGRNSIVIDVTLLLMKKF